MRAPSCDVQVVQRRGQQRGNGGADGSQQADSGSGRGAGGQFKIQGVDAIVKRPGLPPLSALPERFAGPDVNPGGLRRLRFAPSVGQIWFGLSPVGRRAGHRLPQHACQSFCLSVQTAAISRPAPSAAFSWESSLLTGWNSNAGGWGASCAFVFLASVASMSRQFLKGIPFPRLGDVQILTSLSISQPLVLVLVLASKAKRR